MKICPQIKNGRMLGKIEISTVIAQFDEEATLINADGVVSGGNGWQIYPQSANAGEVLNMLDPSIAGNYPRWQNGAPNAMAYIKTPQKGIITSYLTTQWCDGNNTGRICNSWRIAGYETEADMLALANGIVVHDGSWASVSKGTSKTCYTGNNRAFEYYTIHMITNFAGSSYCSMGVTRFYMRLPNQHEVQFKKFKLFGKRR